MLENDAKFNTLCNLYEFVKKDATFEKIKSFKTKHEISLKFSFEKSII